MKKVEKLLGLIESLKFKEFEKIDWSGWAGAESPSKDKQPLIAEIKMTADITVIVDKNAVTLNVVDSDYGVYYRLDMPFEKGKKFAQSKLKSKMTFREIEKLGFNMN